MASGRATATRSSAPKARKTSTAKANVASSSTSTRKSKKAAVVASPEREPESDGDEDGRAKSKEDGVYEDSESDAESLHSDALDEDVAPSKKRKRAPTSSSHRRSNGQGKKKTSPRKKRKEADEQEGDLDLEEGQEIVGVVVQAPKTGRVPAGQISQNTLDFLNQLKKPECNDREWFKLHEPVYRLAEKEWKDFIEAFTDVLVEKDPQIPHLPPKDVIHRIYRDIRFKNDKTPYKTGFSASFSRSGRKGIFAVYHVAIIAGGQSLIAAGAWHPDKNELQTIRNNLLRSSTRFRKIISAPDFVELFGEAKPHPKGIHQNIFGMDDTLKVAPKGIDKTHKDIELLKLRSFVVTHRFTDQEVLDPEFRETLGTFVTVVRPFVRCLNDMMTIQPSDSSDEDGEEEEEEVEEDGPESAGENDE